MKGLLLLICTLLASFSLGFGQNLVTYQIQTGEKYTLSQLESGLAMCDLTRYRLREERVKMEFDDGAIVDLFSAYELDEKGISIDHKMINTSGNELMNTFSVHPKGYLIEQVKTWTKEELANRTRK